MVDDDDPEAEVLLEVDRDTLTYHERSRGRSVEEIEKVGQ